MVTIGQHQIENKLKFKCNFKIKMEPPRVKKDFPCKRGCLKDKHTKLTPWASCHCSKSPQKEQKNKSLKSTDSNCFETIFF